jgi:hypothetical protein
MTSFLAGLFGCAHRRLTRPITPIRKPGEPSGETYVVCLDCGKQFAYDWNHMRIGKPIERSSEGGVLTPDMPGAGKTKLKYALLGSAIPLAVVLGGAMLTKRRTKRADEDSEAAPGASAEVTGGDGQEIGLPHGGPGAHFHLGDLLAYIDRSGRNYIIVGQVDCALADHPTPSSLDYWLRENFARNKETKQATAEVIAQLLGTGRFEECEELRCPDTGYKSYGLRLKARAAESAAR